MFVDEHKLENSLLFIGRNLLFVLILSLIFFVKNTENYFAKFSVKCSWNGEVEVYYCGSGKLKKEGIIVEGSFYSPVARPIYTALFHFYPDDFLPHRGIDVIGSSEVLASSEGTVVEVCRYFCYGPFGRYVIIKHQEALYTMYAHLSRVDVDVGNATYRENQDIGTMLGIMGNTGQAQGVHLHFEVRLNLSDAFEYRQDPVRYIPIFLSECHNMFGLYDALAHPYGSYQDYYEVSMSGQILAR